MQEHDDMTLDELAAEIFDEEVFGEDRPELPGAAQYARDIHIGMMKGDAIAHMRKWAQDCRKPFLGLLEARTGNDGSTWVCQLPEEKREEVRRRLEEAGISGDDLERGMNSRICDLKDAINIDGIV